jgi:predicted ATPase
MITEIGLTNFKCFKGEHNFPLSRFNLLTGINGKGKSAFLQSLLLMKQTVDYDRKSNYIILNGNCVQLGSFQDIKNSFASNHDDVRFSFKMFSKAFELINNQLIAFYETNLNYVFGENKDKDTATVEGYEVSLKLGYYDEIRHFKETRTLDANDDYVILSYGNNDVNDEDANIMADDMFTNLIPNKGYRSDLDFVVSRFENLFKRIQFISADRIGPKNFYEIQNINKDFSWVGAKGENTASILLKKKDSGVHQSLYLGEDTNTLLQQTEEWLNFIFDGAKININTEGSIISITYNTKRGGERYKPSNVGFGYSYILPIVVAGLIAQSGEILIIENPEAHLHPRAQHKLTQFLAKVAAIGVQIFVESHSEHILNTLRIIAVNPEFELNNTDLSVLYFQDNDKQPFVQIPIKANGKIENWPDGFFDQTDKDLDTLISF